MNNPPTTYKHIIIAGGSFAPPHRGHLKFWENAIQSYYKIKKQDDPALNQSQILLTVFPVNDFSPKQSIQKTTFHHRYNLLKLLLEHSTNTNIALDDYHFRFHKTELGYTFDEVDYIRKKYPDANPVVLYGLDNMMAAISNSWRISLKMQERLFHGNAFLSAQSICINDNRGYLPNILKKFNEKMEKLEFESKLDVFPVSPEDSNLSSTRIREIIQDFSKFANETKEKTKEKTKELVKFLFPSQIEYIFKHQLWQL